MADYHFSLSHDFPNGVRLEYLQAQIMSNPSINSVLCSGITVDGDDIVIQFVSELSPAQVDVMNTIVANYENPTRPAITSQTDAKGSNAISLTAMNKDSGITITAGDLGLSLTCTGPIVTNGVQANSRSPGGTWRTHPEFAIPDAEFTLPPEKIGGATLVVNYTSPQVLYMPTAADLISQLTAPAVGDSIDVVIMNMSTEVNYSIGESAGVTLKGSSSGRLGTAKSMRVVLTNVTPEEEEYTIYCFS